MINNPPADGMVTVIGSVNSALFGLEASRAVVMAYDAKVLAGTQGRRNHRKTARLLGIALQQKLPVLLFAEGVAAARFMQLCNAHSLPLVRLADRPGFMVGPETETEAQAQVRHVRHVRRMFIAAAHLRVPFCSVVLREGYRLVAMAMAAGSFHAPLFTVGWPTGEFGAMGQDGAVRLGYRKELEAQPEGPQREALYDTLVAAQYDKSSAINMATTLEIDAVIDPAETRA